MLVRPLHDRLLVKRTEEQEQAVGGIVIPDTAKEKPQQRQIVAAGKGRRSKGGAITPLAVQVGDRIIFAKFAGTGEEFLFLREDEVFAVIEPAAEEKKAA